MRGLVRLLGSVLVRGLAHAGFALAHLVPRRPDLWVFGSWGGKRFADNARYLFLYCATVPADRPRCVWISDDPEIVRQLRQDGLEAHARRSVRGMWLSLRAGVYVFDFRSSDISYPLSGGALRVNLWHGIPLKRIERDIEDPQHPLRKARSAPLLTRLLVRWLDPQVYESADHVVATGPDPARFFQSAFGLRPEQVLLTGYPRNDALFDESWTRRASSARDEETLERLARDRAAGYRIVGYFPTWRDVALVNGGAPYPMRLPAEALEPVLAAHHAKLYCKVHQTARAVLDGVDGRAHIELLPSQIDIYRLLPLMDLLVTDYSSVYFDYLLLDRPMMFYAPDLEEYRRLRTFYYDYDEATPGPKAFSDEELVRVLACMLADYDHARETWREDRRNVQVRVHTFVDGRSSARCYEAIRRRVAGAAASHAPSS